MTDALARARTALKSVFGYDDFRPGQAEILSAVLAGEDVLAVMPTGSGKSLCYQLPCLVEETLTVVVSPLIALMRDQVGQMRTLGVSAATLNSTTSSEEVGRTWELIRSGGLRLLFVSPERLLVDGMAERLREAGARRLAIDEAHCVSQWGHDFRPEYRDLARARHALGGVSVLALTATADRTTRDDIAGRLFPKPPHVFVHSFDRPNIHLRFAAKDNPKRQIAEFLHGRAGESGIVYCASRRHTETLASWLGGQGFRALPYHAGLDSGTRERNQDAFLQEDGVVVAATVAFGMGINKPDVRFVCHADMPANVEGYYQEIGRAGRDGLPAATLTLYGLDDMALRRRQISEKDVGDERRRVETAKLDAMVSLCEAPACRRQVLLGYFGETSEPCGRCDLCEGAVPLYDGTIDAQKALSAVLRTGERFGAGYVTDILLGRETDQNRRWGHTALKTFGVGRDKPASAWRAILRQLFAHGVLETGDGEMPGLRVTDRGREILYGRDAIQLRPEPVRERGRTRSAAAPREGAAGLDAVGERLFQHLRGLRAGIARQEGIAAFMIFADRSLIEMARIRPVDRYAMRLVHGVGERKLETYGDAFLGAIREFLQGE